MSLSQLIDTIDGLLSGNAPISQIRGQLFILREQAEALEEQMIVLSTRTHDDLANTRIEKLGMLLSEAYEEIERLQADAAFGRKQEKCKLGHPEFVNDGPPTKTSAAEIIQKIQATPPFHRQSVEDSFWGIRVSWEAELVSITHRPGYVRVMATIPGVCCSLCCRSTEIACGDLVSAKDHARIRITGTLKEINETLGDLIDCTFELLYTE